MLDHGNFTKIIAITQTQRHIIRTFIKIDSQCNSITVGIRPVWFLHRCRQHLTQFHLACRCRCRRVAIQIHLLWLPIIQWIMDISICKRFRHCRHQWISHRSHRNHIHSETGISIIIHLINDMDHIRTISRLPSTNKPSLLSTIFNIIYYERTIKARLDAILLTNHNTYDRSKNFSQTFT